MLIDYPGFNWWVARRAKAHGIPVFYYAPPQIWAWASWRIKKMRRFVDHVLCSLPFEARWFSEHGCRATFVGHPYFDEVRRQQLDEAFIDRHSDPKRPLVAILPGSRTQEVVNNLKYFLHAAWLIRAHVPNVRFAIASFTPHQAQLARTAVAASGLPIEVFVRRTPELIALAECCMAVSGSVSLELLARAKPTVIQYWISPLAFEVQKLFRNVKYITLVNMLACDDAFGRDISLYDPESPGAEKVLFPEYLTCEDRSAQIARHVIEWLTNDAAREQLVDRLGELRAVVAHGGAAAKAAQYILTELDRPSVVVPRPHFIPANSPIANPLAHTTGAAA